MAEVSGEPSRSEGAIDTAMRIIKAAIDREIQRVSGDEKIAS
jgi:hypothetical protein